ncbi:MAG TPA: RluA family pseudouridine synthase [Candidatus Polarisedimenticolaceae bacterium]|nr:RluA family pseudouridine synthase [Candidatus Polarisedimenticolaceae bacterium]
MIAGAGGETLRFAVPLEADGVRLDRFLTERIAGTTRASVGRLIRADRVRVDERPAKKTGLALKPGMTIRVDLPQPVTGAVAAERIPFDVIYEDDELLVVDKPAGLTVHPGHGRPSGTLVNGLLGRGIALSPVGAPDRPGIVHRLDRETSGLLVVAKTERAHRALAHDFAERRVAKRYRALVWGHPRPADGTVEREIGRSRGNPTRMTVHATRGRRRSARTHYRTIESLPGFGLLDVELETGRTHQIRVHLESIGHPIVGDERYGGRGWRGIQHPLKRKAVREFDRLALHAVGLAFRHPGTGRELRFRVGVPPAFARLLVVLREHG